jgi:hypothetical protein
MSNANKRPKLTTGKTSVEPRIPNEQVLFRTLFELVPECPPELISLIDEYYRGVFVFNYNAWKVLPVKGIYSEMTPLSSEFSKRVLSYDGMLLWEYQGDRCQMRSTTSGFPVLDTVVQIRAEPDASDPSRPGNGTFEWGCTPGVFTYWLGSDQSTLFRNTPDEKDGVYRIVKRFDPTSDSAIWTAIFPDSVDFRGLLWEDVALVEVSPRDNSPSWFLLDLCIGSYVKLNFGSELSRFYFVSQCHNGRALFSRYGSSEQFLVRFWF